MLAETTIVEIRQDIMFSVGYEQQSKDPIVSEKYNLADLFVYYTWHDGEQYQERYGVLIDLEDTAGYGEAGYILQIPTTETEPKKIRDAQVKKIVEYIDEMRQQWKTLTDHVERLGDNVVSGYWDALHKWSGSLEGRWDLVRGFRKNTVPGTLPRIAHEDPEGEFPGGKKTPSTYKSFFDWIIAREPTLGELQQVEKSRFDDLGDKLRRFWTPLVVGCEYEIFLDWSIPYICYKNDWQVSHFSAKGAEFLYYPFHNFAYQNISGTKFRPPSKAWRPQCTLTLKPTNYTALLYWAHLVDQIDHLRAQCSAALKPYYVYVARLAEIEATFRESGPHRGLDDAGLADLIAEAEAIEGDDYDGGVNDWDFFSRDHDRQIALGMRDLSSLRQLFTSVLVKENMVGRNANRMAKINATCRALLNLWLAERTREAHEDLWCYNEDPFGYDMYLEKAISVIAQSSAAERCYDSVLLDMFYEHQILENPNADCELIPNSKGWMQQLYRSSEIVATTLSLYASIRERRVAVLVDSATPTAGQIGKWMEKSVNTRGMVKWRLHDEGIRKLTNFLLGGGKLEQLAKVEAELVAELGAAVGKPIRGRIKPEVIATYRKKLFDRQYEALLEHRKIDPHRPGSYAGPLQVVISAYLFHVAYSKAKDEDWPLEDTLLALTAALGLVSDSFSYGTFLAWKDHGYCGQDRVHQARSQARRQGGSGCGRSRMVANDGRGSWGRRRSDLERNVLRPGVQRRAAQGGDSGADRDGGGRDEHGGPVHDEYGSRRDPRSSRRDSGLGDLGTGVLRERIRLVDQHLRKELSQSLQEPARWSAPGDGRAEGVARGTRGVQGLLGFRRVPLARGRGAHRACR